MSRLSYYIRFHVGQTPIGKFVRVIVILSAVLGLVFMGARFVATGLPNYEFRIIQTVKDWGYEFKWAVYWGYRYHTHTNSADILSPEYRAAGVLEGMTEEALLVMRVYKEGDVERIQMPLADLKVNNARAAAELVNRFKRESISVDYYTFLQGGEERTQVVVWLRSGKPLNEILIDEGVASALSTPPTNIVNQLMYKYHLNNLR